MYPKQTPVSQIINLRSSFNILLLEGKDIVGHFNVLLYFLLD